MVGVDLFAGAGGLSEGAEQAGIDVLMAVECDLHAAATYSHNHPNTKLFSCDIKEIREIEVPMMRKGNILFGGPPCHGFSTSNQKTRDAANPGNWLFLDFLRVACLLMPDWILFENVTGITETANGFFLSQIVKGFEQYGYTCSIWILNAADFGVPQLRKRLFIVGSLHGIKVQPPNPITAKYVTVNEAISDLPILHNGALANWMPYRHDARGDFAKRMRNNAKRSPNHLVTRNNPIVLKRYEHIPQGGNWQNIPAELMGNYKNPSGCHTRIYHRLTGDQPSGVIGNFRKNMLIHPTQHRGLSVREAARLQSFRDSYEFYGSIGFQQQQVGNAVPPLLAKAVFQAIINSVSPGEPASVAGRQSKQRIFDIVD